MRQLTDAEWMRGFGGGHAAFLARALAVALALLLGDAAGALAQPRDGIWEGGGGSFRIRFFVRGNGTSMSMNQFDALRFSCVGREGTLFKGYGGGFSAPIGAGKFTFLDRMTAPRRAAAGATTALVVQGTFRGSEHAEGRINGWTAMLSGQGVKALSCASHATTWEASWVGEEPAAAAAPEKAHSGEPSIGDLLDNALATFDGVAAIESAQTIYQAPAKNGAGGSSIALFLDLDGTSKSDSAPESRPPQ